MTMQVSPLSGYQNGHIDRLLMQIPLFSDLADHDKNQFELLLSKAKVIELDAGEVIIEQGQCSPIFYVLLKGQMDVFNTDETSPAAISQLTTGQLFGTLAALSNIPRTATIAASRDNIATLLAIDFSKFGELDDVSKISLTTKLKIFRNVVNHTRWKLEMYKRNSNDFTLEHELSLIAPFNGQSGTVEELQSLGSQVKELALLLNKWNQSTDAAIELPEMPKSSGISSLFSSMKNVFRSG